MYNPRFPCTCLGAVCCMIATYTRSMCTPTGVGKMTWLIDFEGYSYRNAPPITLALKTLNILQNHYPERLGLAVCYHPPRLFQLTWKVSSRSLCLLSQASTMNTPCVCLMFTHFIPASVLPEPCWPSHPVPSSDSSCPCNGRLWRSLPR